jgi:deaminated glutathione amidase
MTTLRLACVQTTSGRDPEPTLAAVADQVRRAREMGADLITTPEVVNMIEPRRRLSLEKAEPEDGNRAVAVFADLARETGAWLLAGSIVVKLEPERLANRSLLFDPEGRIVARYDKIHMFDVSLEGGESYRESRTYRPGEATALARTPWATIGLTICYDVRFPHLYRALAQAGAEILTVPSAFTVPTGRAHWHVLLRARAIETGCFVVAPAQVGEHAEGRKTYGHSLIVAPWGEVLADAGAEGPCEIVADLDLDRVAEARRMVPSLQHDRAFAAPERG